MDDELRRLVSSKADASAIKQAALAKGMIPLKLDGAARVARGLTTTEEVMRLTQQNVEV